MGAGAAAESAASPTGTGRLGRAAYDRGAIDVALYHPHRPPRIFSGLVPDPDERDDDDDGVVVLQDGTVRI